MNKYTASLHVPLADNNAFAETFDRMIAKARSLVRIKIPVGHQDETGFQLGVKPADNEIKWPPVW